MAVSFQDILAARAKVLPFIHTTPVFTSATVDKLSGRQIYFKAENLQKTGAFKIRGALNKMFSLKENNPTLAGVVTHSSGNHAMAVAYAAKLNDIACTVVVPNNTPQVKIDAIEGYGANVVFCEPNPTSRKEVCNKVSQETGKVIIHSYDDPYIIAGQGTMAVEFLEQQPDLDAIFVCLSGGGMSAGVSLATKAIKPNCKVFLVEPKGKDLQKCLESGERLWPNPPQYVDTIAEGIRVQQVGNLNFPVLCQHAEKDVFTVDDNEIGTAMKFIWERMKLIIETSAAATVAAVLSDKAKNLDPAIKKIGVILCGGNVDLNNLPWMPNFKK